MKHLNYIYIIILLVLVAACSKDDEGILDDGTHSQGEGQTSSSVLPGKELRGVWIATVWGLDWPMGKSIMPMFRKSCIQIIWIYWSGIT